ncbi:unnamed protein product [Rhizophagus irregularis]|nr:unnamed protein product [Rhizophagus irregularis]CAB5361658.1 unnamed protein product [Rhizophagus irregularis]
MILLHLIFEAVLYLFGNVLEPKFKIMVHIVPNDTSFCLRMKHSMFTTFNLLGFNWRNYLKYSKSQE